MHQASEIFNLVMGGIGLALFRTTLKRVQFAGSDLFGYAFYALLLSFVFTVVEGYLLPFVFNLLEHAGYAASGVLFALGCHRLAFDKNANTAPAGKTQ